MDVKVSLDLDELRKRLCPKCQEAQDRYLKELAIQALQKDTEEKKE